MNPIRLNPTYFPDPTAGRPISSGYIYVGEVDTDPEIVANQKTITVLQEDGTYVAVSQPIQTGAGGVPIYGGSYVSMFVDGNYSLKVLDSNGVQKYYIPHSIEMEEEVTPEWFGALGDGVTDDTLAIQAALDLAKTTSGIVFFGDNDYLIDTANSTSGIYPCGIVIPENVTMKGSGIGKTKLIFGSNLGYATFGVCNESGNTTLDLYHDDNIVIEGISFTDERVYPDWNGDNPATFGNPPLSASYYIGYGIVLFNCNRPVIRNCEFYDIRNIAVALDGCYEPLIENNVFRDLGYINRASNSLYIAKEFEYGTHGIRPKIVNNVFNNCETASLLCGAGVENPVISNNTFYNINEAAIYLPNDCIGATITGNNIEKVNLASVSAHGIEANNLTGATITGNKFKNCAQVSMAITGITNSVISGNLMMDNGSATTKATTAWSLANGTAGNTVEDTEKSGILLTSSVAFPVDNVLITGNKFLDTVGNQKYTITLGQLSVATPYGKLSIIGNDFGDSSSIADIYYSTQALLGLPDNVVVFNNVSDRALTSQEGAKALSIYSAREIGGTAYSRMLGLSVMPSLEWAAYDTIGLADGLPTGFTLTRATAVASYHNFAGIRANASAGELRHDYDPDTGEYLGWLIEPARTNYLLNSGTPVTQDVSLGAGTYMLWLEGSGSCTLSGGPTGVATEGTPVQFTLTGVTTVTFTVAGTVTIFQCEEGNEISSYITTTVAAVTRDADILNIATADFNFNALEGTILVEWMIPNLGGILAKTIIALDDATANEIMYLHVLDNTTDGIRFGIMAGGVAQTAYDTVLTTVEGIFHWSAFSYKLNDATGTTDGIYNATDTGVTLPTVDTLQIGQVRGGVNMLNGYIRKIVYFPKSINSLTTTGFRDMTRK